MLCNFIEITLRHGCSPINLLQIFRTPFPTKTSGGLLLFISILTDNFREPEVFVAKTRTRATRGKDSKTLSDFTANETYIQIEVFQQVVEKNVPFIQICHISYGKTNIISI